jgi:hypothetical protein
MTNKAEKHEAERMKAELEEILERVDALPVVDARTPEGIIGYDRIGLPE